MQIIRSMLVYSCGIKQKHADHEFYVFFKTRIPYLYLPVMFYSVSQLCGARCSAAMLTNLFVMGG